MSLRLDVTLRNEQMHALSQTDPESWFHPVEFANASSPSHPTVEFLQDINRYKWECILPLINAFTPGRRVLDVFCANGGFSFEAAKAGAKEVLGLDYDASRIECARFVASLAKDAMEIVPRFDVADVYRLEETVRAPFDVTIAVGGLYHVADPVLVLQKLRAATSKFLILQTARVIRLPGSWGRFLMVRHTVDRHPDGVRAGVWKLSPRALRAVLEYTGFEIVEEIDFSQVPRRMRWWGAICKVVE